MLLDTLSAIPSSLYYRMVKDFERKIGFRISLNALGPCWIDGTMIFDMTQVWQKAGIDAKGINYYTIGAIENGISSRYDCHSPLYQSWLGGYTVQFAQTRSWTIQDHFLLAEADQRNWLETFGDPKPKAILAQGDFIDVGPIAVSGFSGELYIGGGWSHSDVGRGSHSVMQESLMAASARIFNRTSQNLHLQASNLLPYWHLFKEPCDSYQKVYLKGYIAILELDDRTKAVLYTNGTIFEDKQGNKYDYFEETKEMLLNSLLAEKIEKV